MNPDDHKNKKREDIKSRHYIISYDSADVKTEKSSHSERTQHGFENENKKYLVHPQAPVESIMRYLVYAKSLLSICPSYLQ